MSIATELTALSGHITNAYNAVSTKGGTIPANKNMANLDDAILSIPAGADIVNGVIKQYKAATSNISADTFVEFVNGSLEDARNIGTAQTITQNFKNDGRYNNGFATAISPNKVFLGYVDSSTSHVNAVVITISGSTMTAGTPVEIDDYALPSGMTFPIRAILMDSDTVLLIHSGAGPDSSSSSVRSTYGTVCDISGTTITAGPLNPLFDNDTTGISAVKIDRHRVLLSMPRGIDSFSYPYLLVCTVRGYSVQAGTPLKLNVADIMGTSFTSLSDLSYTMLLDDNRALTLFIKSTTMYALVSDIQGDIITVTAHDEIATLGTSSSTYFGRISSVVLSSSSVFFTYPSGTSGMAAAICSISNSTITVGTSTSLDSGSVNIARSFLFQSSVVGIYYNISTSDYISFCTISGTNITFVKNNLRSSQAPYNTTCLGALLLDDANLFLSFGSENKAIMLTAPYKIQASQTKINGVTVDDITTSTAGDVWTFANDTIYDGDADARRY